MKKLRALIVDDEVHAVEGLEELLKLYCPEVEVTATSNSIRDAVAKIVSLKPDIAFLDVEMPGGTGFDLAELASESGTSFVFVTSHSNYAHKAFTVDAVHYLLKPVSYKELRVAVERAIQRREKKNILPGDKEYKITISGSSGIQFVMASDVTGIEGEGRYSTVHTKDGSRIVVTKNVGEFETELQAQGFFRVHKSWLVNCKHVKRFLNTDGGTIELSSGQSILLSRRRKAEFLELMKVQS